MKQEYVSDSCLQENHQAPQPHSTPPTQCQESLKTQPSHPTTSDTSNMHANYQQGPLRGLAWFSAMAAQAQEATTCGITGDPCSGIALKNDGSPMFDNFYWEVFNQRLPSTVLNGVGFRPFIIPTQQQPKKEYEQQQVSPGRQQMGPLTYQELFQHIKNTNMPKKFMKMFKACLKMKLRRMRQQMMLEKSSGAICQETTARLRLLTATSNRLERKNLETAGISDLAAFFCGSTSEKMQIRRMMKNCLGQLVFEQVLCNDSISIGHKFSYLKCIKTMEWRMRINDDSLVTRVQSNF